MADFTVNNADVEALGTKLEGMNDQFTPAEQAALQALFSLAGTGIQAGAAEVEGFAFEGYNKAANFELNFANPGNAGQRGILIGLLKNPLSGMPHGGATYKIVGPAD